MKTHNKILLGGFIVLVIAIVTLMITIKAQYNKAVAEKKKMQTREEIELEAFNCLEAQGNIEIQWKASPYQKVVAEGNKKYVQQLTQHVKDSCLILKQENPDLSNEAFVVHIHKDALRKIKLDDGSNIITTQEVIQPYLDIELEGRSRAKLKGTIQSANIACHEESIFRGEELKIDQCNLSTTGESRAFVRVNNLLKAEAKGKSTVYYSGEPRNLQTNTSEEGSIREK